VLISLEIMENQNQNIKVMNDTHEKIIPNELQVVLSFMEDNLAFIAKINLDYLKGIPANSDKGFVVLAPKGMNIIKNKLYYCYLKAMSNKKGYVTAGIKPYGHTIKLIESIKKTELILHVSCIHQKMDYSFVYNPSIPDNSDHEAMTNTIKSMFTFDDIENYNNAMNNFHEKMEVMYNSYKKQVIIENKKHKFSKSIKSSGDK
jgi:hypothetical protein